MPKASFTFDLSEPYERERYELYAKAEDAFYVLRDLDLWLRNQIKYAERDDLQEIRDYLTGLCQAHDISLY